MTNGTKSALIFGVTGQAGSHLAELLLAKGYDVVGVARRVSTASHTERIQHLLHRDDFKLVSGDITDPFSVQRILTKYCPEFIFNLSAQSHVGISFEEPSHTWDVTAKGVLNILEVLRSEPGLSKARFFQASTSEMFGSAFSRRGEPGMFEQFVSSEKHLDWLFPYQDEETPFVPNSPYAIAKLAAHHLVKVYREAYGLHASCGIMFNFEGPRRGENFVTKKITRYAADLYMAQLDGRDIPKLKLGNLDASRDWNYVEDTVQAMWLMLQQDSPDDYVIASGETHTVKEFLEAAFAVIGVDNPMDHVEIDTSLYRPCEVPYLRGDASKARAKLGWAPEVSFKELVNKMVAHDLMDKYGEEVFSISERTA